MVGGKKINPVSEVRQSLCYVNTSSELLRRKEKELSSFGSFRPRSTGVGLPTCVFVLTYVYTNWSTDQLGPPK